MKALLVVCALLVFAASGCTDSSSSGPDKSSPKSFAELAECRTNAEPLLTAIETINEATEASGAADMEALTSDTSDEQPAPLSALGAPMYTEPMGLYCSKNVRQLATKTARLFSNANVIYGNYCYMDLEPAKCDTAKMQQWMVAGLDAADQFIAAVDRKVTKAEATGPAQPAGTVNLTGSLRLYDDIATAPDGGGDTFCYGKGAYRDLFDGAALTVTDATGTKVALGELEQGYPQGSPIGPDGNGLCVFPLAIESVPDQPGVLTLDLAGFLGPDFTIQQYKSEPSTLVLVLGQPG